MGVGAPPTPPASSSGNDQAPPRAETGLVFRHPQAAHQVRLGEVTVAYHLQRASRRSIGMVVGADGLSVRAPRWVSHGEIEQVLREKADWICRKLADQHRRAQRQAQARIDWQEGATVPVLGESVILVLDERVDGAVLHEDAQALPGVARKTLHLGLPQQASGAQIRDAVNAWLQRKALELFQDRVRHFAGQLGVQVRRVQLSSARTRWGSASADGSIRLHWRLVHFGPAIVDYVVAHELAHLREMNHSPRFWDVVASVLPDYHQARRALRHVVMPD